ncbi:beta-glucosidase 22-like [Wolffia australiana]
MGVKISIFLLLLLLQLVKGSSKSNGYFRRRGEISRDDFPANFVFGSGTSAYQVEGAASEGGRTPSVWDVAAHQGKIPDGSTGDTACDGYHKYKDDIRLVKDLGLEGYRFSISWSRLIPNGRGDINSEGLRFYNNFIDELIRNGIQPHVTLFHYDLPQVLEDEYGGWLSPRIVDDFAAYADVCFSEFGDRISYWTTLNEPNVLAIGGYDAGIFPPYRCSSSSGYNCSNGDSAVEPYLVAHHSILAHAEVTNLYRRKYQAEQHGFIGCNVFAYHFVPFSNLSRDEEAVQRAYDFYTGWFVGPLVNGDYPRSMVEKIGNRMPSFSSSEQERIRGTVDFLGVNYYATLLAADAGSGNSSSNDRDFLKDVGVKLTVKRKENSSEIYGTEFGMQGVLEHFKNVYGNPPIFIHENGYQTPHNSSLEDTPRVEYLKKNIQSLHNAIRNGSNTRGYFIWSFLDLLELIDGHRSSYGLVYINFEDKDLTRKPKLSAKWYSQFLKGSKRSSIHEVSKVSPDLSSA